MTSSDDDRIAYLAGGPGVALSARDRAELDDLRAELAEPSLWAAVPSGLEDSVVDAVSAAARGTLVAGVTPLRQRNRNRLSAVGAAVAAAAALVVVVAGGLLLRGGDDHDAEIRLAGQAPYPEVVGTAAITREESGLRIELDAVGLPRRDGGDFYQAWLKDDSGGLVPIGTFHTGEDVVLWAGVAIEDFPILTVTEETDDGDQASSGRVVLAGELDS